MVYLLHFEQPISAHHSCQHYCGYCDEGRLRERMAEHRAGSGARLTQVAKEREIGFQVVRIWPETRRPFERRLKKSKNLPRLCPHCSGEKAWKRRAGGATGQPYQGDAPEPGPLPSCPF